jgi:chromosome segregation ATPase
MELFDIVADAAKTQATAARTMGRVSGTIDSAVAVMAEAAEQIKQDRDRIAELTEELRQANQRIQFLKSDVGELRSCLQEAMDDAKDCGADMDCAWIQWARALLA